MILERHLHLDKHCTFSRQRLGLPGQTLGMNAFVSMICGGGGWEASVPQAEGMSTVRTGRMCWNQCLDDSGHGVWLHDCKY